MEKVRKYLDVATTILVLLVFLSVSVAYVKAKLYPKQIDPPGTIISKDLKFADALDLEYGTHSRTLVLALSKDCIYCASSIPFYKSLIGFRAQEARNTQLVAIFPNDDWETKQYLRKEGLENLVSLANVNYSKLGVHANPTLILLDRRGRVLESWAGQLDSEREKQVLEAISGKYSTDNRSATSAGDAKKETIFEIKHQMYDINLFPKNAPSRLKLVDVDNQGQIYIAQVGHIEKRSLDGKVLGTLAVPQGVDKAVACVDVAGSFHFITSKAVYTYDKSGKLKSPEGTPLSVPLGGVLAAKCSKTNDNVYILSTLTNSQNNSSEQMLHRLDVSTGLTVKVHQAHLPFVYNQAVGLGRMDFTIGDDKLYISDVMEYKIYTYSLRDNSLLNTFSKQFIRQPIGKPDGKIEDRGITIEDLTQNGQITHYPAIFNLNYVPSGRKQFLVWTSERNSARNQAVDVYDSDMNYLGTDFKPTVPVFADYYFIDDKVIVPDYGFGKEFHFDFLSPLEVPYKPRSIKVFRLPNMTAL